jgi:hypothetical protein
MIMAITVQVDVQTDSIYLRMMAASMHSTCRVTLCTCHNVNLSKPKVELSHNVHDLGMQTS